MTAEQTKTDLKLSLQAFASGNFTLNALSLFQALGYITERQAPLHKKTKEEFRDTFISADKRFEETKARFTEWQYVDLLFQLSKEEVLKQTSLFDTKKVDSTVIETYLFFAIELSKEQYSRTELSLITREVNRLFPMPAMILFRHGNTLTLSVINRRLHKRDESKDVLEKVTQIKDINIASPHRAHIEILFDLSFDELKEKFQFTNFVELHNAWQKTLDTKELNKKFFNELANWYFWATTKVAFPDDEIEDKEIRNATGVIRLITRLMFVWFLKEKNLVPEDLFDEKKLKQLLKYSDENKSTYYKAILQNLFFATLNTEMGKRKFRSAADKSQSSHYFIHNLFRYENEFLKPKETLEKYFDPIPFLNGGLFECLDKQIEKNGKLKPVRIDGFSDREDNVLKVPDELFFSEKEKVIDLSKVYGTPKKSREKVRGLIDILSSYKFTIAENTPIEEEVALDPELLGKVFENLLANYNPETQTTARKQTGSFYTPREIVNYMVDESLLAYLKQNLNDKPEIENNIRELLSYSEKEFQFSNSEREKLIHAIDTIKIIDPACGSGAFPMGILHKLVHTLHKLDPKNELWKQRQIEKASAIDDITSREAAIETIEEAFENNELDYGRKLYLIENCIYGVDIQPIAVQISKLRFFISLIVEQKTNPNKENLGVRPLPNLETKFVAANTLMELEKENANLFTNPEIEKKKDQLKKVRHDYFEARTPKRKENCRNKDKQLRDELAELLVTNHDLQPATAKKVAAWNPYDQNASANFFDMEWMFGLKNGFDVVIGNPPYLLIGTENYAKNYKQFYSLQEGKPDLYRIFIEKSFSLLNQNGVCSFITPNTFLTIPSAKKLREHIVNKLSILSIVNYDQTVFESASVNNIVYVFKKCSPLRTTSFKSLDLLQDKILNESNFILIQQLKSASNEKFEINIFADETVDSILSKIRAENKILGDIPSIEVTLGLQPYHNTLHTESQMENRFLHSDKKKNKSFIVELGGRDVKKYSVIYHEDTFLDFSAELYTKPNFYFFEGERLVIREILSDTLIVGYTKRTALFNKSCYVVKSSDKKISNKYLLILLNSKLFAYYIRNTGDKSKQLLFPRISMRTIKSLPVRDTSNSETFNTVSDYLIYLSQKELSPVSFFERLSDAMVYELYLPEAIQNAKCEVLKYLNNLPELKEGEHEKNLKTIEKVYKELSDTKHPVSRAIEKMDGIEEIRIIEGKK
jgi:adenine-specific DNA-methyltransferase